MPAAVGALLLPTLLSGTTIASALGAAAPFVLGALGGGIGNRLAGGDFWRGAAGGLAGGLLKAVPFESMLSGLGGYANIGANALRGGLASAAGGGDPLQGAVLGAAMGTEPVQRTMNQLAVGAQKALLPGTMVQAPAPITEAGQPAPTTVAAGAIPGAAVPTAPPPPAAPPPQAFGTNLLNTMAQAAIPAAVMAYGQKSMADANLNLARELDTGRGVRTQAANMLASGSFINDPAYQSEQLARQRRLNRLAAGAGLYHSGNLAEMTAEDEADLYNRWWNRYAALAGSGPNLYGAAMR